MVLGGMGACQAGGLSQPPGIRTLCLERAHEGTPHHPEIGSIWVSSMPIRWAIEKILSSR